MSDIGVQLNPDVQRHLLARLPTHMLTRDNETGGELRTLLTAVSAELELLETDIRGLYDGWFVETCDEWLLPYLADLIGIEDLPPDLGPGTSRRALVANTVRYRRRKGSAAVLANLTADVTGWSATAVQFFALTATTANVNDIHLDRPATVSIRNADSLRLAALARSRSTTLADGLDRLTHTAEVRRIGTGRGRYNINGVGVFVYPLQIRDVGTFDAAWSTARPVGDGFTFDPMGWSTPLFALSDSVAAEAQTDPGAKASPVDGLPVPLPPHRLLSLLERARRLGGSSALPVGIKVRAKGGDVLLGADSIRVCGVEALGTDALQAMVDPVTGRVTLYRDGKVYKPRTPVKVRYSYGALGNIGAGTFDRSSVHELALASDPFHGIATVTGQVAAGAPSDGGENTLPVVNLDQALVRGAANSAGTYVISIVDSTTVDINRSIEVKPSSRLVVVAADWPETEDSFGSPHRHDGVYVANALRSHVRGNIRVRGGSGSSLVLDGLLIEGDLEIEPGSLGSLTISQSTIVGTLRVVGDATGTNRDLQVRIMRSVIGGVDLAATVPVLSVTDTVIDDKLVTTRRPNRGEPFAIRAAGTQGSFEGVTIRGGVQTRSLDATNCIFDGTVKVVDHQIGCIRYSFVGPDSVTPRRFHCATTDPETAAAPVYSSEYPGAPDYMMLSSNCPRTISAGGEEGTEMGVHSYLRRPLRLAAVSRQLSAYQPAGRAIGIFGG